jgi:hypothetical protein
MAHRLRELDELEPERGDGRGQLYELRSKRRADAGQVGRRLSQGDGPPPGRSAHEPRRERELPRRPPHPLLTREHTLDEHGEAPPKRVLVRDRLGELEPLRDPLDRLPCPDRGLLSRTRLLPPRQAPGAPAVRPQSFGHGATREPGKLSDPAYAQLLELLVALALERQE